jgi:uncharacterized protein involved in exopolysaccharide biosynthesis
MKQLMEAQLAAAPPNGGEEGTAHPSSPADIQALSSRMEIESQLKANKVEIENRQSAIHDLQKRIGDYQARLNVTPMREQQLAGLTRDYEQSRRYYEGLLAKTDLSGMATELEKQKQGAQFSVLDPPNLPQKPFSPNRLKIDLIGLVAGLLVGGFILASAEIVDDRIYSKEELAKIVSAPVLTEIPPLTTAAEQRQQTQAEWLQRAALGGMVVVATAGFASTYLFG